MTSGVTHALSLVADLFLDRGDVALLPDKFWENYELLFGVRYKVTSVTVQRPTAERVRSI